MRRFRYTAKRKLLSLFLVRFVVLEELARLFGHACWHLDMNGHAGDAFEAPLVFVFQVAEKSFGMQKVLDDLRGRIIDGGVNSNQVVGVHAVLEKTNHFPGNILFTNWQRAMTPSERVMNSCLPRVLSCR